MITSQRHTSVLERIPSLIPPSIDVPGPWTRFCAGLATLSGSTFSDAALAQDTSYDCLLFVPDTPACIRAIEQYPGNNFVSTTAQAKGLTFLNPDVSLTASVDAEDMTTVTAASRVGGVAVVNANDVQVEGIAAQFQTIDTGLASTSGGAARTCNVALDVTVNGPPLGAMVAIGGDGQATINGVVLLDAANYTEAIRDAGNIVTVGTKNYLIVGLYSLQN